ncbi:winged helix-turn-helix domain-containing protein [Pantoea sp. SOD02]|uniref:winged helix-turn-helix domain-containing protein n=1 Tax=Pantoea sp. SOD02 TaxID=2970818 RepID=UPI002157F307|nr:winged helix-turn-helix domain-containing protein [Pantoea sp. SOD02]UVC29320.1 winged helix-turn-helix domain-containing protein [Pantoea sp. SOD02]
MSVYIIERTIVFDSDMPSLAVLRSKQDPSVISAAAARCLVLLIEASGETVQREQLMHAGWGSVGQVVSDNSLNQAITQLRKVLKEFSMQGELIMTVPRLGYKISRMFTIEQQTDEPTGQPIVEETSSRHHLALVNTSHGENRSDVVMAKRHNVVQFIMLHPMIFLCTLIIASYALFYFTQKPVIHQMMTKFHTVNYLPVTSQFNDLNVFFNDSIEQQGGYLKDAISQFERDTWLHRQIGDDIRFIYINGSYNRDVFSYFLCSDEIQLHPEGCRSYTSIKEGN